jgi:hypothetical protein
MQIDYSTINILSVNKGLGLKFGYMICEYIKKSISNPELRLNTYFGHSAYLKYSFFETE